MSYGTRISKEGYDVLKGKQGDGQGSRRDAKFLAFMISGIALSFLYGAAKSLQRYIFVATRLKEDPNNTFTCMYEASSLMEHLDAVDRYVIMCGDMHPLHEKILNIRNHIRHDLRDNLSQEGNGGRTKRARKLGISESLLVDISFDKDHIRVGTTYLTTNEIADFMDFAKSLFTERIEEAQAKGYIKGLKIVK